MIGLALLIAAASADPISGTWEGSSLCQVKPSACHDEHVVYKIIKSRPRGYRIDGYRLTAGKPIFMGSIEVMLDAAGSKLDGPVINGGRLNLALKGTHLSGRMTAADGALYRLIEVDKH